ncbi:hypothetical protein QF028_002322 [Neobacillus sp. B4I6]|jgi:hypothetical protein|uniref:hypothetical protein n=1 Tax=Bacillaceae TaxID=186817 RepID=UPI000A2AE861|nr:MULTISPECIES: hypothetical protein [unclassified Bacillus (in: firmicutes)]MBT2696543.1 hypothetical protein [Bacillus sp. ISL-40]SMQ77513.1 hypothetical protein SAMN05444673_2843 [Bacillus sp. OV166]
MKIMTIGIILVVVGCSILGWLIKESYKNYKNESTKIKIFYFLWAVIGVLLDTSGLIILFGFIFLGILLIIYH